MSLCQHELYSKTLSQNKNKFKKRESEPQSRTTYHYKDAEAYTSPVSNPIVGKSRLSSLQIHGNVFGNANCTHLLLWYFITRVARRLEMHGKSIATLIRRRSSVRINAKAHSVSCCPEGLRGSTPSCRASSGLRDNVTGAVSSGPVIC